VEDPVTDTTALDELLPERPYLILDPHAHRHAQNIPGFTVWLCDICSTELDPTRPVMAWGTTSPSYALCRNCLPAELSSVLELEDDAAVFTPCRCPGCTDTGTTG
jgi:hypothetical protein